MATANIIVGAASSIPTPPAGEATLFIDTDNNNILSLKNSSGVVSAYSESGVEDCCSCDIAKTITDKVMCAFSSGMITADEFGVIMGTGFSITSTSGTNEDGNKFCTVDIGTKGIAVTGINIDQSSLDLDLAPCCGGSGTLTATVSPANASNKKVLWVSGDPSIATVDINTGLVTAVSNGMVTITAYTQEGGFIGSITVTITTSAEGCC